MTTLEMQRTEYGSIESQPLQFNGPLSSLERQQIVDDILDSVKNPNSQQYNPALATELQLWTELKSRSESDPVANAIVEMVRAGDKQLQHFFPPGVQAFIGKLVWTAREQTMRDARFDRPPSSNGSLPSRYR